jgi:tRNA threonylcarbamoyladenosine biosynthesis protein TsaB
MILIIDTSSSQATIATVNGERRETQVPARSDELRATLRRLARDDITKVAVVTGPGSFTGLRVGVAFGLGLAMGRGIPIVPLPTLELQAARSREPVTAIADAGRGRFYYRAADGQTGSGSPAEIPVGNELVGKVERPESLIAAGHRFKPDAELRSLAEAAEVLLESAREVPYGSVKLEYMQSFGVRA